MNKRVDRGRPEHQRQRHNKQVGRTVVVVVVVRRRRFCVEKCLKEDFVNGQMSRDNPCRIIGFEEAKQLKPCQSRKEHDEVSEREFLVGGFIYGLDKKKNEDTWSEAKNPVLFKRIIAGKPRKSDNYTFIWFGNHQATRPVTTQDWNYTGLEMAADIGGYVGVLLGISFLSISHGILERLRRSVAKDQEEETKNKVKVILDQLEAEEELPDLDISDDEECLIDEYLEGERSCEEAAPPVIVDFSGMDYMEALDCVAESREATDKGRRKLVSLRGYLG
ncbi:unnamed protein product [Cyprideis torosa]|uniref:Uncharacterized protein n=1 Tax=Cyprideis torosa TaxID=163714 RepID=A0A7R8ZNG1_9CRUS|nr:unnamed protein product [Cyprideis torosa]CAG0886269.1 unnamed protein product [Cyprideis torosa]